MKYKQELTALVIFSILSFIFVFHIFQNIKNWGIHDWDQHLMYNGIQRRTILEFKQFPLWSSYHCGGNVMLANPQSSFLNPLFIFVLIFGEVMGLKLLIFIYLIIGLFGMFLLTRYLKISLISSYLSAFLFMLSGVYSMRMSIGHTVWMQIALIPYIFLFYLKSFEKIRYIFLSALFMTFIFLGGGIYPLLFIILFLTIYSILSAIRKIKVKYLKNMIIIFLLFILFSSIKLIPMLEFTKDHSYKKEDLQDNNFKKIIEALTFRGVESRLSYMYDYRINGYTDVKWGWHEYHAYIGILPLLLFLISSIFLFKKEWPLISVSIIFFLIALGENSIINIFGILKLLPFISDLHGASRFLTIFIFSSSLIIGKFTSIFENKREFLRFNNKLIKLVLILFTLIIFIDLLLVNSHLFKHSFVVKPIKIEKQEFSQVTGNYLKSEYPIFLANLGIVNCFEKVKPTLKAIPKFGTSTGLPYSNYIGEAYIYESNKTQQIIYFSPNKIKIKTNESGTLVLNQNFVKGWKVKNKEIKNVNGLIGANVNKGEEVIFYYQPNSFILGATISLISLFFGLIFFIKRK